MKLLVQRVKKAEVKIIEHNKEFTSGSIENGLLVFLGFHKNDTLAVCEKGIGKLLKFRIFPDENGKMNYSVFNKNLSILIVPQFTLYADVSQNRPGFTQSMHPENANKLYKQFLELLRGVSKLNVQSGIFGVQMDVSLVNEGPATFIMEF